MHPTTAAFTTGRVLILGGNGTISTGITTQLKAAGAEVVQLNRGRRRSATDIPTIIGDRRSEDDLRRALASGPYDAVIDMIGFTPDDADRQDLTWRLAAQYLGAAVRRPIVDFEPCYEGHGYNAGRGRFSREDVRRAIWWGILGGAAAGVGYGAHGVWQWYRPEARFTNPGFSLEPFPVDAALRFAGADDAAFAAEVCRVQRLFDLVPRQDLLAGDLPDTFRVAGSADLSTIAIYAPDPRAVRLALDLSGYDLSAWDLSGRRPVPFVVTPGDGGSTLEQPDFLSDAVVVLRRRSSAA